MGKIIKYDKDDLEEMSIGQLVNNFTDIVLPVYPSINDILDFFKKKGYTPSNANIEDTDKNKKKLLIDGIIHLELNRGIVTYSAGLNDLIKYFANTARISQDDKLFLKKNYTKDDLNIRYECITRIIATLEAFYSTQISKDDLSRLEGSISHIHCDSYFELNTATNGLRKILLAVIERKNVVPSAENIRNGIKERKEKKNEEERKIENSLNSFFSKTFPDKLKEALSNGINNSSFFICPSKLWGELCYEAIRQCGLNRPIIEQLFSDHSELTIENSCVNDNFSDFIEFYLNNWDKEITYHAGQISFGKSKQEIPYNQRQKYTSVINRWRDYQRAKNADDSLKSELKVEIKELAKYRFKALLGESFNKRSGSVIPIKQEFTLIDVLSHLEEVRFNPYRGDTQLIAFQNMSVIKKYLKYIEKAFRIEFTNLCQTYKIPFMIHSGENDIKEKAYTFGEEGFFISEDYISGIFNSIEADENLSKQRYKYGYQKQAALSAMYHIKMIIIRFFKKINENISLHDNTSEQFRISVEAAIKENHIETVPTRLQIVSISVSSNSSDKDFLLAFLETTNYFDKNIDGEGNVTFSIKFMDLVFAYFNEISVLEDYLTNSFAIESQRRDFDPDKQYPSLFKKYKIHNYKNRP